MKYYSIAIDGPAGAGKSTIAKLIAQKLDFVYVDTGAMYRAAGLYCLQLGIDINSEEQVVSVLEGLNIRLTYIEGLQHVFLGEEDVSDLIRTQEIGNAASVVSAYAPVRKKLVALQQKLALTENIVMDGRDIASVVLPNADLKLYLTASVKVRALRRYKEYTDKGENCDLEQLKAEIEERDYRDMHREVTPLIRVPEAVEVDSSNMSIDEVVTYCMDLFERIRK